MTDTSTPPSDTTHDLHHRTRRQLLRQGLQSWLRDGTRVSLELFKLMIPVLILTKILKETGLIVYAAAPLGPVMELVGLPAQTGLVWASAILVNLYTGLAVFAALLPEMGTVTVAQATILGTMMLVAHNLLVEGRIAQKCGAGFWLQNGIRLVAALVLGLLMHWSFSALDMFTEPSRMLWQPAMESSHPLTWAWDQVLNLGSIYLIVLVIMGGMRILNLLRITDLLEWLLAPVLRMLGIGRSAATISIIGLSMGLAYGGGLIIDEARSGKLSKEDIFNAVTLMGLTHALIEDTLLMALMGAHTAGTLWWRLFFSLAVIALLTRARAAWRSRHQTAQARQS